MTVSRIAQLLDMSEAEVMEEAQRAAFDSVALAVCPEFCEVEPDGLCEHGRPSILLALGAI